MALPVVIARLSDLWSVSGGDPSAGAELPRAPGASLRKARAILARYRAILAGR